MTPDEEVTRGHNAERVLRDEIYQEAYSAVRDRIIAQLSLTETTGDKRERLNNLLIALETVRRYMENVVQTGKMAAQQIERDRTFTERMRDRMR